MKKSEAHRAICKDTNFVCHLEKATEKVQSWPEWKKNILGQLKSSCDSKAVSIESKKDE